MPAPTPVRKTGPARHRGSLAVSSAASVLLVLAALSGVGAADDVGSLSIGYPWNGQLRRAMPLEQSRRIRFVPSEFNRGGNVYGNDSLIGLLERAARRVTEQRGRSLLAVGELSARAGGPLRQHRSHQNGLDADLGFYVRDDRGRPVTPLAFVRHGADGWGRDGKRPILFDTEANWALVAALLEDPHTEIRSIFVAHHLKERLLDEARREGAPRSLIRAAEKRMTQPTGHPHDNHFHVRIACPEEERPVCRNVDDPPLAPLRTLMPAEVPSEAPPPRPSEERALPVRLPSRVDATE